MSFIQCLPAELPQENVNKLSYFLRLCSKENYTLYITRINFSLATPNIFGLLRFNGTPVQFYFSRIQHLFTPFSAAKEIVSNGNEIAFLVINSFDSRKILSRHSQGLILFLTMKV